jgi:hypothetical protein
MDSYFGVLLDFFHNLTVVFTHTRRLRWLCVELLAAGWVG